MKLAEDTATLKMAQKTPSITSGRSSKQRRKSRKKKANQWTFYIETLKSTIDRLYDMCRIEHSVSGCKESLIYLQNGTHDFLSLIEAIRLEESFNEQDRPQSLAWEIRKSTSSPIHQNNGVQMVMNSLPSFAQVVMANMKGGYPHSTENNEESGWQLVQRRRRSISSTCTSVTSDTADLNPSDVVNNVPCNDPSCGKPLSVYERLSGSHHRCPKQHTDTGMLHRPSSAASNKLTSSQNKARNPKSVMDIPQTKSSMAKISYCRQRIWENEVQPCLAEKLRAKQRREKSSRSMSSGSSSLSRSPLKNEVNLPLVAKTNKPTYSMVARKKTALDASRSLQSINETVESAENDPPALDKPLSLKDIPGHDTKSEPAMILSPTTLSNLDLCGDPDWREMTEEEQSLAMEEESIKLEIEKMESELESLDAEISRQRDVEVEIVKTSHKESTTCENICFYPVYKEGREKLEEEFKKFCQESWSEMVEREFAGKIHTPGQVVDKLEKIASPSRRRCEKDEENLSQKYEEKLRKAEETRLKLQQDKVSKLKDLSQKREEVHTKRIALGQKIKEHIMVRLEKNMERVKENRDRNLTEIVRKAKEDEQKVLEVQFINSCVDMNMRQDILDKNLQVEERKQSIADERARKFEEKAARELAVEQRRRKAEQNRKQKLLEKEQPKEVVQAAEVQCHVDVFIPENTVTISEDIVLPAVKPLFSKWSSLCDPSNWPNEDRKLYRCTICDVKLHSQLECMAHITQPDHLGRAGITAANATNEIMDKQLDSIEQWDTSDSENVESIAMPKYSYNTLDEVLPRFTASAARFEKKLLKGNEAMSSRDRCKPIVKLLSLNWKNKSTTDVRKFERTIIDLMKTFESDKDSPRMFGDALAHCPTSTDDLLNLVMNWDSTVLPDRLLIKLAACATKLSASSKFVLSCIMSKNLLYIAKTTTDLVLFRGDDVKSSDRLCSLFDFLTNVIYRSFYDSLGIDGQPVVCGIPQLEFWELINYTLSILSPTGAALPSLIEQNGNAELRGKATRFAKALACRVSFADSKIMASFFVPLCDKLLVDAVQHSREKELDASKCSVQPTSNEEDLSMFSINLIYSLQIKEALWEELLRVPLFGFRLFLVMSDSIRTCPKTLTESTFMNEFHNLVYLTGCFAARDAGAQILCQLGGQRSMIATISSLPLRFFIHKAWSQTIITTLITMTKKSTIACEMMSSDCSPIYLYNLLKKAKNIKQVGDELSYFVPREEWDELIEFYHSSVSVNKKV